VAKTDNPAAGSGVRFVTVDEHGVGQRLDNYLLRILNGVPKTRIYRGLRKGEFRVNKGRARADQRLEAGDVVRIPPIREAERGEAPRIPGFWIAELTRRIVHEDPGLLVINKPSGLAVHGGSGLNFGLIECLRQMRPQDRYLELVHRLDRDTSGLIMIARKASTLRELHRQLRDDRVDKRYLALAVGQWPRHQGLVEAPLAKNTLQSGERMVRVARDGKQAATEFSVIERFSTATLLEAKPITGRTHQIRVHAQFAGHPLLGDDKYADDAAHALARELGLRRLFLHARSLSFTLPDTGHYRFQAPLDEDLELILDKLRN
jgi:23S rRNA pseudouridine955/2504/2580 synthase